LRKGEVTVSTEVLHQELLSAVSLAGSRAVLRVSATYQPAGGAGSKVFPPTYPTQNGQPPYVLESRMVDGQERRRPTARRRRCCGLTGLVSCVCRC
jgi:hypothetical protein